MKNLFKQLFPSRSDSLKIKGSVALECRDKDGHLKWQWADHNTITNAGKAAIAGLAGNTGGITAFTYLAVGTDSTAATAAQTALLAEIVDSGLARSAATVSRVTTTQTNDTLQLTFTWTASGSKTVQEVGVFNASSSGTMLGRALTGAKALANTDVLVATYKIQLT